MIHLRLFLEFFKIGLFTFGGGYAMIPLIEETVIKYNWMDKSLFYDFIGVCESTPGPIAINMATYIGSTQAGLLGSITATIGVVLPSFIIIVLIASVMKKLVINKYFQYFMDGIKPVIIGLILSTGLLLILNALTYNNIVKFNIDIKSLFIFIVISSIYFISKYLFKRKLNTVLLIVISAIIGISVYII